MKRVCWFLVVLVELVVLAGCGTVSYRMDGLVPIEYPQSVANDDERVVYFAPRLTQNQWFGNLYIITNPESLYDAQEQLANRVTLPLRTIESILKGFSAVKIQSTVDANMGNGIAIFSVPPVVDKFFYAYISYQRDGDHGSGYNAEVFSGVMPFPAGTGDVYMGFSPGANGVNIQTATSPAEIKRLYDGTTGMYGTHLAEKQPQMGFIEIGLNERMMIAKEIQKEEAFEAGSTLTVNSAYFSYRQEKRQVVTPGDIGARGAGSQGTGNANSSVTPGRVETVDIPVRNELAFELYQGTTVIYKGKTPAKITGLAHDKAYTLRWVSPDAGNREFHFTPGLNFSGYPDSVHKALN